MTREVDSKAKTKTQEMVLNPHPNTWPNFPYLPIKKGTIELGIIWAGTLLDNNIVVYECNLFLIPEKLEDFLKTEKITYYSIEEFLDDDWIVD